MCVVFVALNVHPKHPLILLANRDEFYARPTAAAHAWAESPHVFAGRDLAAGGTWLGIGKDGRVAAVTNYREPGARKGDLSRGGLVADYLNGDARPDEYLAEVAAHENRYSGFNLLVGEFNDAHREMYYFSNRGSGIQKLEPGIYGLSNHLLNTPWPKVKRGTERLSQLVSSPDIETAAYFDILSDESLADDVDLPETGVGYELEKALSAIFIRTPIYGTRCSTIVTLDDRLEPKLEERVFV